MLEAGGELKTPSRKEELANGLTHGLGAVTAVPVLVLMVVRASLLGDPWMIVGVSIFGASLVLMYTCSTLYHALPASKAKARFRIFDHVSIFILIAGTYTPFTLGPLRGPWGWSLFGVVWGLALIGAVLKVFFTGRFGIVSVFVYIGMGWLVLIAFHPLLQAVSTLTVGLLAAGGMAYTLGTVFYASRKLRYNHSIWHLFVLAGSVLHTLAIFTLLQPPA
ncbi:MAG: hemolysin III family protein [Kiritimatiellae bacterium]|nr:hemolysin III family protein [Kiritimatiellia bacterium]